ncbi:CU044_5270 family protein [Nonomuraea sp. NPDC046802]|uniref:CU044_5270 family protein n=1 Tax=Nonomuraea sp. NPDC046802 TaxID=3154919 RepID=UPI0033E456B4
MVDEIDLLRRMRDEVPADVDVQGVERRLATLTSTPARPAARPARWRFALAGACALTIGTVVVSQLHEGRQTAGIRQLEVRTPDAATVLESAALVAGRTKAVEIRPDQWFYLKESQHLGGDLPAFESWGRMDGTRQAVRVRGKLNVGDTERGPTHVGKTHKEIENLPADPDALLDHFRALKGKRTPLSICEPRCPADIADSVKLFGTIGWYMKFGPMIPPDTSAAMYRALAKIPGVTVEENTTDGDGRTGIGVVLDAGTFGKAYYVLDAKDYRYLGVKIVEPDGATVSMSVLGSGIVDRAGDVP